MRASLCWCFPPISPNQDIAALPVGATEVTTVAVIYAAELDGSTILYLEVQLGWPPLGPFHLRFCRSCNHSALGQCPRRVFRGHTYSGVVVAERMEQRAIWISLSTLYPVTATKLQWTIGSQFFLISRRRWHRSFLGNWMWRFMRLPNSHPRCTESSIVDTFRSNNVRAGLPSLLIGHHLFLRAPASRAQ